MSLLHLLLWYFNLGHPVYQRDPSHHHHHARYISKPTAVRFILACHLMRPPSPCTGLSAVSSTSVHQWTPIIWLWIQPRLRSWLQAPTWVILLYIKCRSWTHLLLLLTQQAVNLGVFSHCRSAPLSATCQALPQLRAIVWSLIVGVVKTVVQVIISSSCVDCCTFYGLTVVCSACSLVTSTWQWRHITLLL